MVKVNPPALPAKKRRQRDDEDDKIAYLEAKLGLNKKSKSKGGYAASFAVDGLDGALRNFVKTRTADESLRSARRSRPHRRPTALGRR